MNPLFDLNLSVAIPPAADRAAVGKSGGKKNRLLPYNPPAMHELHGWLESADEPAAHDPKHPTSGRLWHLYRELLELCQDACLVTDSTGAILTCNSRAVDIFGMPSESMLGLSLPRLIDPDDWEPVQSKLPELLTHGTHLATEICVHPPDGSMRFAAITLARVPDVMQEEGLLQWVIRDVTEQNRIEEGLRSSKERLDGMETVLQQSVEGVIVRDVAGRIVFANDTAAKALNSPFVQLLLGATIDDIQKAYVVMDEFLQSSSY